jgi:glycosyltransferase involved in cell wall biosynthesis
MRQVIMIGPSKTDRGGVASVIKIYEQAGLFAAWPVRCQATAVQGSWWMKTRAALAALLYFIGLLVTGKKLLLHAHTGARSSFWRKTPFFLLSIFFRQPFIVHLHDGKFSDFFWNECGDIRKLLIRFILQRANQIIVLTPTWRGLIGAITGNPNLLVIVNPVEVILDDNSRPLRNRYKIIYLGGSAKSKGIFDLLCAVAKLMPEFPATTLVCGGIGDMNEITQAAKKLGIEENVETVGWIENEKKSFLLNTASIYVLPSYHEGLPMGILEAMALGLPIVASNVGGIPDVVIDGKFGILIPPGDVEAQYLALKRLFLDVDTAEKMGVAGRLAVMNQYAASKVVGQLVALYRRLDS